MDPWQALDAELDRWSRAGRRATWWWRDDDAHAPTPALEQLLALAAQAGVPVSLAVIPAHSGEALARRVHASAACGGVLQHGWSHHNHAPGGEKCVELGHHRPAALVLDELAAGFASLRGLFADRFLPVLVPPWNRVADSLLARLPEAGYTGVSTFAPRRAASTAGLRVVNCHVDPVAWRRGRGFAGVGPTLDQLCGHLAARREGAVDAEEPTGLLTHHAVHDVPGWAFLDALLGRLGAHPACQALPAQAVFPT